jgi:hypothetical protein
LLNGSLVAPQNEQRSAIALVRSIAAGVRAPAGNVAAADWRSASAAGGPRSYL